LIERKKECKGRWSVCIRFGSTVGRIGCLICSALSNMVWCGVVCGDSSAQSMRREERVMGIK
jgi:hypothetical protein